MSARRRWRLAELLGELDRDEFLRERWGRRSTLLPHSDGSRFRSLVDESVLRRAVAAAPEVEAAYHRDGRSFVLRCHDASADELLDAGYTVCVSHIEALVPAIRELVADVRKDLPFLGEVTVNCYASPPGAGFGMHLDSQHTLILQAVGDKQWAYGAAPLCPNPLDRLFPALAVREGDPAPAAWPDEAALEHALLGPGDCLYLPPGVAHRAAARTRSIALTLTLVPTRRIDLLLALLLNAFARERNADETGFWRGEVALTRDPPALMAEVQGLVARAPELLSLPIAEHAEEALQELVAGARVPAYAASLPLRSPFLHDVSAAGARLRLSDERAEVRAEPDGVTLETAARRLSLPAEAERLVRTMVAAQVFSVAEALGWDPELDPDEVRAFLRELLIVGALSPAPPTRADEVNDEPE
ncbi:JmjC domain-containing protein [Haliangium sp.]|uniref:JmjC domain-containing protein n=1 Tax=Haliangium sp. TaxID=2663208 RepID=UPI003D10B660